MNLEEATAQRIDLAGEWIGRYSQFDCVVRIENVGDTIVATKVTGDDYVPAGEITWRISNVDFVGEGLVSERDFQNPFYIPGRLIIVDRDHISFIWDELGQVDYRRDD